MFGAIAVIALIIAIVNGLSAAHDAAKRGGPYDPGRLLFWELSSIAMILLAMPILVVAIRRMRRTTGIGSRAGLAMLALAAFATVHIGGMVWIRKLVLWLAGGVYDFGFSLATLLYEFRKDAVTVLLLGATIWLIDSRRDLLRERKPAAPARSELGTSAAIWLRDGASRIRIEPGQILWVSSAGNYIEYRLADGVTHLIRGTLASAEAELARYGIVRIHRMRLVNLDRVTGVEFKPSGDFELTLGDGQILQGSRRYRGAVATLGSAATST
jgi:hypothetical protein